ncbi:MAG: hypothetical protein JEY94_00930 [Melioribacteraceae bacterium]|nr:hypothetical protein [Melioribacteraceae bacterium]
MEEDIYGITYACPHGKRKTECPLIEIEHLSLKEKLHWINHLQPDQKRQIINFHLDCSVKREFK